MHVIYVDDERSAHVNFYFGLKDRPEVESSSFFFDAENALEHAKDHKIDAAFLDISLGGDMGGMELAKALKELQPNIELAFITAYDDYAREAYRLGGRGYLSKPFGQDELDEVLFRLKHLQKIHRQEEEVALRPQAHVTMKTFGNFDLLVDQRPVSFKNAKAKELLAYLVHQRGGSVNSAQLFLALWEHLEYSANTSTYVRRTVRALREELEAVGLEDILMCKRNCYSVDVGRFVCDYYDLMEGNPKASDAYQGEYMNQYSWGESTIPFIERKLANPPPH